MTRSEFLNELRHKSRAIRNDVQKHFYFLESEDLRARPAKGKWSIIEVFAHVNLTQEHYIREIKSALENAPEVNHDELKLSWLGKQLTKAMQPRDGEIKWKMRTFRKLDPLYHKKRGVAVDEKVVFQNLIADIEELEDLMLLAYDRDIAALKIPTVLPILKINVADALSFDLAHTERHLLQAKRIVDEEASAEV